MSRIYDYSSWKDSPFVEDIYNQLLHQPDIIHFTNSPKPCYLGLWVECKHPEKDLFFYYLDMTDCSGGRDSFWRRLGQKFMKMTFINTSKLWKKPWHISSYLALKCNRNQQNPKVLNIMKILVTGTEGYLGSLLPPLLIERGHEVIGVDTGL